MRVLGLIPARGGSKGIPRKNIRPLCGKPLLWYTAQAAQAASLLTSAVLSTDDDETAEVGLRCGLEVPFRRPAELAEDTTPTLPVVQHALRWLAAQGRRFDAVCLLQPTSPLRRPEDIDACIQLLERTDADAVLTVLPVPAEHNPHWVYFSGKDGSIRLSTGESSPIARRQDLPPAYHREGSVYVTRTRVVMDENSLYGSRLMSYPVDPARSVNIDTASDWDRAAAMIASLEEKTADERVDG